MPENTEQSTKERPDQKVEEQTEQKDNYKKRVVLGCLGFSVALVVIFLVVCLFLKMTEPVNVASLQGIYKEKDSLDVVVVGASEAYANYCAPLAYEDYGYTSYSYGVSGVPGSLYKSMIKEVLDNQKPKLVVVEMNGLLQKDYYYERQGNLHGYLDNINNYDNRAEAIEYAVPESQKDEYKLTSFLDVYHNSWQSIEKCFGTLVTRIIMFFSPKSHLKGYATFGKIAKADNDGQLKSNHFTDKSKAYFEDLLDYCDTCDDTEFVFVRFPHMDKNTEPEIAEQLSAMANAHGYKFVDFSYSKEEAGIEPIVDYYNDEHFNARGAEKFTKYFGNYLVNNYDVMGEHSEAIKASWDESVEDAHRILTRAKADIDDNLGTYFYEFNVYYQ